MNFSDDGNKSDSFFITANLTKPHQKTRFFIFVFFKYSTGVVGEKMKLQDIYIQQAYCRPNKRIKLFPS